MSEGKLILPDFLLADLYKNTLVDLSSHAIGKTVAKVPANERVTTEENNEIKFLGENAKSITILVNQPGEVFLKKSDLTFLINILKACQLTVSDIAIVNVTIQPWTFTELKKQLHCKYLLLFDVEPSTIKLPFTIPVFQINTFDSCTIMMAPTLANLNQQTQESKLLKTKLWMSLKQIFEL